MLRRLGRALTLALGAGWLTPAFAYPLPEPLDEARVVRLAREHRAEIPAARARAHAARERIAQAGALEDPVLTPAIDHYPFEMEEPAAGMGGTEADMGGADAGPRYDWSISLEQSFPLSGLRGHRRRAAASEAERLDAEAERTALDVQADALRAFYMLHERRRVASLLVEQEALAQRVVASTAARYASGAGSQSDVLRAELELARTGAQRRSAAASARGSEAMLNASLGRDAGEPIPELRIALSPEAPEGSATAAQGLPQRPELRAGAAEVRRADAERDAMESMYLPMGMVRVGRATTMAEGPGAMLMLGVSLPLWLGRLRAGVQEAQAMQAMARADLDAMRRMIEGEAAAAREALAAARVELQALRDDVLPRAEAAMSATLAGYAAGQVPLTGVLDTAQALRRVQLDAAMAEANVGLRWTEWRRASGSFGEPP